MKQSQLIQFLKAEFGAADITDLNKKLRQKDTPKTKYRLGGKHIGHLGVTGTIKMVTDEGLKVTGGTRTTLVRFTDIESIQVAKDRTQRPKYSEPKKPVVAKPTKAKPENTMSALELALADDEEDDGDYSDLMPVVEIKRRPSSALKGKSGSKFIPKFKKK